MYCTLLMLLRRMYLIYKLQGEEKNQQSRANYTFILIKT